MSPTRLSRDSSVQSASTDAEVERCSFWSSACWPNTSPFLMTAVTSRCLFQCCSVTGIGVRIGADTRSGQLCAVALLMAA
jgi:hypothetical protein